MPRRAGTALAIAVTAAALGAVVAAPREFRIDVAGGGSLAEGARGATSLTIHPLGGRHISKDGPLQIDLAVEPASGLRLDRHRLRREGAADPEADAPRFEITYRGSEPGSYRISTDLRFWICGERTCRPVRERLTVPIEVTPAADAGVDAGTID